MNDGDWCDPLDSCDGRDQPFVLLNGNAWQAGSVVPSGGPVNFAHTFPSVTVPAGQTVDLSFAGKVEGANRILPGGASWITPTEIPFYLDNFVDGGYPPYPPAPCWLGGFLGNNPSCPTTWVNPWTELPYRWFPSDLDSQQVAQVVHNPNITGPSVVWWFNGVSPAGYATQITLSTSGDASSTWTVLSGASSVSLSGTTGTSITVTVTCPLTPHG